MKTFDIEFKEKMYNCSGDWVNEEFSICVIKHKEEDITKLTKRLNPSLFHSLEAEITIYYAQYSKV